MSATTQLPTVACSISTASATCSKVYQDACRAFEAIRLIELGARATLARQLTGFERKVVNRLFRECHGRPSPPGLLPFTDRWYLQSTRRLLHTAVIWRLHCRLRIAGRSAARALIDVYEGYLAIVREPVLCLTRAAFVPRLVEIMAWAEIPCRECGLRYLQPGLARERICPGCRDYRRFLARRTRHDRATSRAFGSRP